MKTLAIKIAFLSIILLSLLEKHTNAQSTIYREYKDLLEEASILADSSNYTKAIEKYDSAFLKMHHIPYDYVSAFKTAMHNNNYDKAYNYLVMGTKSGLEINNWSFNELQLFKQTGFYKLYQSQKDSLLKMYFGSIDYAYYQQLIALKERDQSIRETGSLQMLKNDSINFKELIELCQEKGFPTFEKVGYGHNKAWILLWHQRGDYPSSKEWQMIIPYIEEEIEKGKVDPEFFSQFEEFKKIGE